MESTYAPGDSSPSDLLSMHSIPYIEGAHHLYIGSVQSSQGWILHLSVLPTQLASLLDVIIPELSLSRTAFKVIRDRETHYRLNAGYFGQTRIGKAVTVYAGGGMAAAILAIRLVELTQGFKGPRVETDLLLSPVVYARYGSFKPFRQIDVQGYPDHYIYDGKRRLIRDEAVIPCRTPEGIVPPFPFWTKPVPHIRAYHLFGQRYLPIRQLEKNPWGGTWLALRMGSGHHCLILEGKQYFLPDESGRDIRDRFRFRQRLSAALAPHLPIPRVYDCFEENGDTFLAVENLRGTVVDEVCLTLRESGSWYSLPLQKQNKISSLLSQVAAILEKLSRLGYTLATTSARHWKVTPRGRVYLDDLDAIYVQGIDSTSKDAFAQLCIQLLTGLDPNWIDIQEKSRLRACLEQLLRNTALVDALLDDAENAHIIALLSAPGNSTAQQHPSDPMTQKYASAPSPTNALEAQLQRALATLSQPALSANRKWFSLPAENGDWPHLTYCNGIYQGISGVLYLLREAAACGFDIHNTEPLVRRGLIYLSTGPVTQGGLFMGSAGLGIGLYSALCAGYIPADTQNLEAIRSCMERETTFLDVESGIAGQGLASLHCAPLLGETFVRGTLKNYAYHLIEAQQMDGVHRDYSFGHGVAGIAYFLLEYGHRYQDDRATLFAARALRFLAQAKKQMGFGWFDGTAGIALVFLRAYEYLRMPHYKQTAQDLLRTIPAEICSPNLSLYSGLSGLGDVYLEAARILKQDEWSSRADWIAQLITHMAISDQDGACYWHVSPGRPTADLMVGNTGVMHFLLRRLYPEKVPLAISGMDLSTFA